MTAGRSCPLHYRYGAASLARAPEPGFEDLDLLVAVGGLYGNEVALQQVLADFEAEPVPPARKRLVFNGDFHWFDADPAVFARVQAAVLQHTALRGNVETELADLESSDDAGCGCGYPDWVGDGVVERSNRIQARLKAHTRAAPALAAQLRELPMTLRARVGGVEIAVVHGDADTLAGWGFAFEHVQSEAARLQAQRWFEAAKVDAFVCTHTCLPVLQHLPGSPQGSRLIANNGATGMPNFRGDLAGLVTRITQPSVPAAHDERVRASTVCTGPGGTARVELVAVPIDTTTWQAEFLRQWPRGSDAHTAYWQRITQGPDHAPDQVLRGP